MSAAPIFVLSAARSGSTLLRRALDAHPEVACPPEANLAAAFESIHFAAHAVAADDADGCEIADELCRELAERTLGRFAREAAKSRWCEKSLHSLDNPEILVHVFPDAQFLWLFRQCTDTIASAVESCPWGYGAAGFHGSYGFEEYVQRSPANFVYAVAAYWADKAEAALRFEAAHPDRCRRLRYEDLVRAPAKTLGGVFDWLGLGWSDEYADPARILGGRRTSEMPGDYKIRYTTGFETSSTGRGWTVPIDLIHPSVRERIDRIGAELGYSRLSGDVDERSSFRLAEASAAPEAPRVRELLERSLAARQNGRGDGTLALVLVDGDRPWTIDFARGELEDADGRPTDCTILSDAETLLAIARGSANAGVALRRGALRLAGPELTWDEAESYVDALSRLLRG
jgi:hypothetical protein